MSELKFDGEVIPVTHLLPDDVLVFTIPVRLTPDMVVAVKKRLRELIPESRKIVIMDDGADLSIERGSNPIPLGES